MQLNEIPDDSEPEPKSAVTAAAFILPKRLEQVGNAFGTDAFAGIGDAQLKGIRRVFQRDAHRTALRSEFESVRNQVPNDLLETLRIQPCSVAFVEFHCLFDSNALGL